MCFTFDLNLARKILNISADKLTRDLGTSYSEISQILHNKKRISDTLIGKMYRLYGSNIFLVQSTQSVSNNNSNKYNKQPEFGQKEVHMNTDKNQTENSNRKTFPVYNQKMAGYLMMQGFVLVGIAPNDKYKGRNVFFFWDSPQIKETMKTYLDSIKKE